jgi:hypothetical protein
MPGACSDCAADGRATVSPATWSAILGFLGFVRPNALLDRALLGFVWPSGALFMFKRCFYYGFAVGFVCAKCQKWLRNRANTGGSRWRGKPRSVGRVKRDRLRHVPAFACKYNRWKSESALPCKQQEIYREIFSRKLNRQNLARTRASRPGFHPAAKASGGGPPHDIPSSQRAKNNPRRGNPHRGSNTIM